MEHRQLSEPAFYVLTALADQPRHGYAIMKLVAELSDGRVQPRVGTLYGILDRLVAEDSVRLDRDEVVDGRLRRYYRLTDRGRRALADDAARQAANAATATARLARLHPAALPEPT